MQVQQKVKGTKEFEALKNVEMMNHVIQAE